MYYTITTHSDIIGTIYSLRTLIWYDISYTLYATHPDIIGTRQSYTEPKNQREVTFHILSFFWTRAQLSEYVGQGHKYLKTEQMINIAVEVLTTKQTTRSATCGVEGITATAAEDAENVCG